MDWKYSDYARWISDDENVVPRGNQLRNELIGSGKDYEEFVTNFSEAKKEEKEVEKKLFGK